VLPHSENPNRGDADAIAESIEANGFFGAILVHEATGRILAGEHRWRAARAAGLTELPALLLDCDDATARRVLLADNQFARLGTWDEDALTALLGDLAVTADGLAGTGFTDDDLARLLGGDNAAGPDSAPVYDDETIVSAAFAHYRKTGFPYPRVPLHEAMQEVNALAASDTAVLEHTRAAYHVAESYHPQRHETRCGSMLTPHEAFGRDDLLRHALALHARFGRAITDISLVRHIGWVHRTQAATQFRPGYALWQMRRHAPAGGRMLDCSAGWGGRLVGYAASALAGYVGIDPSPAVIAGNRQLADDLRIPGVTLICAAAEDVQLADIGGPGSFDFALTSPPYFAKERYNDDAAQSCVRYPDATDWRSGFLVPVINLQFAALRPGAVSVLNIADVKLGGTAFPLARWARDAAVAAGFSVTEEQMPLPRHPGHPGRGDQAMESEPVFICRKPS